MAAKKLSKKPGKKPSKKASKPASKPGSKRPAKKPTDALAVGAKAANFSLPGDGGATVSLKDFAGRKLVLYFYPRADTPGCTIEAMDFSRLKPVFERAGTAVVGVSADPVAALDKFKGKRKLTIALATDETHRMLETYGVWQEKSLYGRKFLGLVRTTLLIGPDGRIARIWPKVKVAGHAEEVLAAAEAL